MHLIVTHANADFDAVASLLGAWLLHPDATPLLPNTLNRNVRDFITLYEDELPFMHFKELAKTPITHLTIVDSQQVPTFKQITADTKLQVIDHHELQREFPDEAIICLVDTGANATQFVEELSKSTRTISSIQATLLLLGIYEDTGSLTYSNTTARDLKAAAWLLEEGRADLDILRGYLNYAMSEAQKALYERLITDLETHTIQGHTVMLAMTQIDHYVEEISNLAHQIRELYRPDALFVLVGMKDHIQLVARSTTDAIDVGRLAEFFGGGGHLRAAACLIKQSSLPVVKAKLLRLLNLEVKPATTVAEIMSHGARVLHPTDTVRRAANVMERYGHEGFPVVDPDTKKIVGILSRREIDKARRHRLEG
ncbi:MAG: DHHA1 domain-containing protein, partial [Anaerolineae bacterium]|nr:DHHA1 domain-containing protein [Anaerolineae bacterium]